jgi:hypothetical protein
MKHYKSDHRRRGSDAESIYSPAPARSQRKDAQLAKLASLAASSELSHIPGLTLLGVAVRAGGTHIDIAVRFDPQLNRTHMQDVLDTRARAIRHALARRLNRKRTPTVALTTCGTNHNSPMSFDQPGDLPHES